MRVADRDGGLSVKGAVGEEAVDEEVVDERGVSRNVHDAGSTRFTV